MEISVEKLGLSHVAGVADIEKECFSTPWSENAISSELENLTARFFVALSNDQVVGYGGMHIVCGECYIANIAVKSQFRNKGIASALLKKLEETAKNENAEFITLEVRQSNENAIRIYSHMGYKAVGVRKNFYSKPKEDGIIMTKEGKNL